MREPQRTARSGIERLASQASPASSASCVPQPPSAAWISLPARPRLPRVSTHRAHLQSRTGRNGLSLALATTLDGHQGLASSEDLTTNDTNLTTPTPDLTAPYMLLPAGSKGTCIPWHGLE